LAALAASWRVAAAQPWPAGGGVAGEPAWLTVFEDQGQWRLVMVPPRDGLASESGMQAGQIKAARALSRPPVAAAAVGDQGVVVFDERGARTVLSGRAVAGVGGVWTFEPADRLEAWATPPAGRLVGFAGWGERAAMLVRGEDPGGGLELYTGTQRGWEREEVPAGATARGVLRALGSSRGTLIGWDEGGRGAALWRRGADGVWDESVVAGGEVLARAEGVFGVGDAGAVVSAAREGEGDGELVIRVHRDGVVVELARVEALAAWTGAVVEGASPRLVALWRDPGDPSRERRAAFRVVEVSLATGRVMHDGPPRQALPVTAGEFRIVAAGLVAMTLVALIAALRPGEGATRSELPVGTAMAGPGRRFLATVLDALIASAVSAWWFGAEPWMVVTGAVLVVPGGAWGAVPGALVIAGVMGAVGEAVFAGSPGKLLTGCRVARARGGEFEGPGVWRSVVRNGIKWAALPLTMPALVSPGTRHRGELAAGTVVVVGVGERGSGAQEES
jgi:hypothetical protein